MLIASVSISSLIVFVSKEYGAEISQIIIDENKMHLFTGIQYTFWRFL